MINWKLIAVFLFVFSQRGHTQSYEYLINYQTVGALTIGSPAENIYNEYGSHHLELVDLFLEAFYTPAFQVIGNDGDIELIIELTCNEIYRFTILSEKYSTDNGIKVGSTIVEISQYFELREEVLVGEMGYFIYAVDSKTSFRLNSTQLYERGISITDSTNLSDIPNDLSIEAILIY